MKLLSITAENFSSYGMESLKLSNIGLSLVYGATGSGKSTLQDMVCWALFGKTSKGGTVDEVKSWSTDKTTFVLLSIEHNNQKFKVLRTRGKHKDNDLIILENSNEIRGKDINETQKLLEDRVGFDFYLYSSSAYFHEFSPTNNFFISKAKERREVFETIADLSLPTLIVEKAIQKRKEIKEVLEKKKLNLQKIEGQSMQLQLSHKSLKEAFNKWENEREIILIALKEKAETFNDDNILLEFKLIEELNSLKKILITDDYFVEKINNIKNNSKCKTCGGINKALLNDISNLEYDRLGNAKNLDKSVHLYEKLKNIKNSINKYEIEYKNKKEEANPFIEQLKLVNNDIYIILHNKTDLRIT